MIGLAPQVTAPWTELRPTPPVPMTTTLLSGGHLGPVDDGAEARW